MPRRAAPNMVGNCNGFKGGAFSRTMPQYRSKNHFSSVFRSIDQNYAVISGISRIDGMSHLIRRHIGGTDVDENVAKAQICEPQQTAYMTMGKRGTNTFRRNDALRALRVARDAGIEPAVFEIVAGGVTYRVFGSNVAPATGTDARTVAAWDEAIAELKATPKGKGK